MSKRLSRAGARPPHPRPLRRSRTLAPPRISLRAHRCPRHGPMARSSAQERQHAEKHHSSRSADNPRPRPLARAPPMRARTPRPGVRGFRMGRPCAERRAWCAAPRALGCRPTGLSCGRASEALACPLCSPQHWRGAGRPDRPHLEAARSDEVAAIVAMGWVRSCCGRPQAELQHIRFCLHAEIFTSSAAPRSSPVAATLRRQRAHLDGALRDPASSQTLPLTNEPLSKSMAPRARHSLGQRGWPARTAALARGPASKQPAHAGKATRALCCAP